jgi:hypothetical protein
MPPSSWPPSRRRLGRRRPSLRTGRQAPRCWAGACGVRQPFCARWGSRSVSSGRGAPARSSSRETLWQIGLENNRHNRHNRHNPNKLNRLAMTGVVTAVVTVGLGARPSSHMSPHLSRAKPLKSNGNDSSDRSDGKIPTQSGKDPICRRCGVQSSVRIPMIHGWFCSGCLRSGTSPAAGRPTPSGAYAARQSQLTVDKQTSRYRPTERVGEKAEGGSMK